jgi:scyllo-inositol 2-dehydrogenase (NADP+)
LKVAVVGLGIQGKKRSKIAASDVTATVDPVQPQALYKRIEDVPESSYDAVLVCTPDDAKLPILRYLLDRGKHVLVEKPLLGERPEDLAQLDALARERRAVCYTAYNHRFEPHIVNLKQVLDSGRLGKIYSARFFYGNGTARDARNSPWRDRGFGVLPDLGSHLLDTILFLFGPIDGACRPWRADRFENRAYDRVVFGFHGPLPVDCEVTMLSWRNTFYADVYGELGSAHISCLCKWGPSTFTVRQRIFPSGVPKEETSTLECADPTWALEYEHFKTLCQTPESAAATNTSSDIWIQSKLQELTAELT